MTYKYKLARRLAISRQLSMVSLLLLLAACSDETMGPDTSLPQPSDATVVVPSTVTIETNQKIRFRSETRQGKRLMSALSWRSTGGTISADGVFSASVAGTYKVVGRGRGRNKADTSVVIVIPPPTDVVGIQVTPGDVAVDVGSTYSFSASALLTDGSSSSVGVSWAATGGSIDAAGVYKGGSNPGKYRVIATNNAGDLADTASVTITDSVTNTVPTLANVVLKPASFSLSTGGTKQFNAYGHDSLGDSVAVAVAFSATGGTISSSGLYTAGNTAGTYRVVASADGLADTAAVTVTAPAPTLASVVVKPASYSLTTGGSRQFAAYGLNSVGDSVVVQAAFSATGGTISSSGLYTAGSTTGTYRVIASASGFADTAAVTLTAPTSTSGRVGLPFGMSQQLSRLGSLRAPMTMTADGTGASTILSRISDARSKGYKLVVNMTGGPHSDYMSTIDGVYQFDLSKWRAKMDTYNTSAIRQGVAQAVADGIIVGNSVMDEPYVSGNADGGGNTWGPKGTMTKARVDDLCRYVKQLFPTMAVGVAHQHASFEPTKSYYVCDFIIDQYDYRRGDVRTFRDDGLAMAARDHHSIMFGINVMDGGVQDKDGTYSCDGPGQGGKGTYAPNCRMTPDQVRDWGLLLGKAGCGLYMWRADDGFLSNTGNQQALRDLAAGLNAAPGKSCLRP